jgi:hypothetical protein
VHWRHSNARHNWVSLHAGSGRLEAHVNKFLCQHMDAAALLQLMTGPLRAVSSQIALRDIALDPSAFSSPLITRVFYSMLPETAAEQACRSQYVHTCIPPLFLCNILRIYPGIFQSLNQAEEAFSSMSHVEESAAAGAAVVVHADALDCPDGDSGMVKTSRFVRFCRRMIRPFAYFHLLRFLLMPSLAHACVKLKVACSMHRHWANLLSIDLEHLMLQNLAALQNSLSNTAAAAAKCCHDGPSGAFSLSSVFSETVDFFRVKLRFRPTLPVVSLVSRKEIVSSMLYITIFLVALYSFLFIYLDTALFPIFALVSSAIFYLGVSGCILLLATKLFRILIHEKVTTPLLFGHPVFSLLHDALLLRQSHVPLHPLLLSTEDKADGNIVAALLLQTPICSASKFLMSHSALVPPEDDRAFEHLGSALAAAARLALQHGMFPSICVGSGGDLTNSGRQLSKVMKDHLFIKLIKCGALERDHVAVDWWCGLNISGKRFAVLHQLGLAPTINVVYVSDRAVSAVVAEGGVPLTPHLPLHDSGPIGM